MFMPDIGGKNTRLNCLKLSYMPSSTFHEEVDETDELFKTTFTLVIVCLQIKLALM
jgi:hypothetical protein